MRRGIYDAVLIEHDPLIIRCMWSGGIPLHKEDWNNPLPPPKSKNGDNLVTSSVPADVYNTYRLGRDSACGDVLISTKNSNGAFAVLLSMRRQDVCFGGMWWIHGGALLSYASLTDFVAERAEKECGIPVTLKALLGIYRTCAADYIGSTLQPCYAAEVPYEVLEQKVSDAGHTDIRLFTIEEWNAVPNSQRHWYVDRVIRLLARSVGALKVT